jgi:putative transposase
MESYAVHWPCFYTATINNRKYLLHDDRYKDIVISSLQYLVEKKKIRLFAFVIMSNHIHLIWQSRTTESCDKHRHAFMKYTAQQFKFELMKNNDNSLSMFKVIKQDRAYQFWKRDPLSIELFTEKVYLQKMEYIHNNPVKAGLCTYPEDYKYSSAKYYHEGDDTFGFLSIN